MLFYYIRFMAFSGIADNQQVINTSEKQKNRKRPYDRSFAIEMFLVNDNYEFFIPS